MGPKAEADLKLWGSAWGCGWGPAVKAGEDPLVLDREVWYYLGPVKPSESLCHYCFFPRLQREMLEMSGGRSFGYVH